jgi:hypothetical protein
MVLNVNCLGDEVSRASSEDYASISHFPEEVLNSLILIAEWLCNNDKVQQNIPPFCGTLCSEKEKENKMMKFWMVPS